MIKRSTNSTSVPVRSHDPQLRHRNDELAAVAAVFRLGGKNFIGEIPRQQQHRVGPALDERARIEDRQVRAGREKPLLIGAAIDDEIDEFAADAAVIKQRRSLGRGAVGGNSLALTLRVPEIAPELRAQRLDLGREGAIGRRAFAPGRDSA
jgi:hypothetical protein